MQQITAEGWCSKTNGVFVVYVLCLVAHVCWRYGGFMDICKGEIRGGEPVDQGSISCSMVSYRVGVRRLSGHGL